jgi:chromatin remodeling complex protein RSC6
VEPRGTEFCSKKKATKFFFNPLFFDLQASLFSQIKSNTFDIIQLARAHTHTQKKIMPPKANSVPKVAGQKRNADDVSTTSSVASSSTAAAAAVVATEKKVKRKKVDPAEQPPSLVAPTEEAVAGDDAVVAAAAASEKKVAKPRTKKPVAVLPKVDEVATSSDSEPVEAVTDSEAEVPAANTLELMSILSEKLAFINSAVVDARQEVKSIIKTATKEQKILTKALLKKRKTTGNRSGGFTTPSAIRPDLAEFLGVDPTAELSRVDVSKQLNNYINAHNLKDPANKRIIHPDAKISKLIRIDPEEELTYFNLQRCIKHLFVKKGETIDTPV